jgi:hypothetical protein
MTVIRDFISIDGFGLIAKNAKLYAEGAKEFFFAVFALFLGSSAVVRP